MEHYTTTRKGITFEVFCQSGSTRHGFKHTVELWQNGYYIAEAKICYLNRTWERYRYESTIHKAIDAATFSRDKEEDAKIKKQLKRQFDRRALPASCWRY